MRRLVGQLMWSESNSQGKRNREFPTMNPVMITVGDFSSFVNKTGAYATERWIRPNSLGQPLQQKCGERREKGNGWNIGLEIAVRCKGVGDWVFRRLYSKWSSCSGAPSGQTMIYGTHLQNLVVSHPTWLRVCYLALNCKLAIPILVKGSRCMKGNTYWCVG
jgi:hypothetical protein